jgi:hypothetical protein
MHIDRRDFLKLMGVGGVVFASGLRSFEGKAEAARTKRDGFFFVQVSDTHWGFSGPAINPDAAGTLKKAVAAINGLREKPEFVMFTGDLTHTTDDDKERRIRLAQFRDIAKGLTVRTLKFMPGEHDAGLDEAEAYKEFFGETHYAFDHKGIHFVVLDNVSSPSSSIGQAQLDWLSTDLKKIDKDMPLVIFTHRPLFDLYPQWDWYTRDGARAIDMLMPYSNVTVFYGHIHQEHHQKTGHIAHHAARGMMYPLPAPGSVPVKSPIPWDANRPYKGLGFRGITAKAKEYLISEFTTKGERL